MKMIVLALALTLFGGGQASAGSLAEAGDAYLCLHDVATFEQFVIKRVMRIFLHPERSNDQMLQDQLKVLAEVRKDKPDTLAEEIPLLYRAYNLDFPEEALEDPKGRTMLHFIRGCPSSGILGQIAA